MTQTPTLPRNKKHEIIWEKLPSDFQLPDEPVDNILQPLLAAVLREILELAGSIGAEMLIATNFGLCAKVDEKIVVKAPDWMYVAKVIPTDEIRRSYTPHREGEIPLLVMEFLSETDGGEYSVNPNYPYGKWYFYERILEIPIYAIFEPKSGRLEVYRLREGHYEQQSANQEGHYWIEDMRLHLGVWQGSKAEITGYWLRWWDEQGNLLPWGTEVVEQERQRTEQERQRAEQEKLRALELEAKLARYQEQFGELWE